MRRRFLAACTVSVALAATAWISARHAGRDARAAPAAAPTTEAPSSKSPRLVVLHGVVDGDSSEVSIVTLGAVASGHSKTDSLGRISHARASARRGALLPTLDSAQRPIALVAVAEPTDRRSSYDSSLVRIDASGTHRLVGGLAHAVAPLVSARGVVLVARGTDGAEPTPDESKHLGLRIDALTLDRIDPTTGAVTTLWRSTGYQAFPAATTDREEALIAHQDPTGCHIFALDLTTGAVRALASVPPFARDFSYDRALHALVFADREAPRAGGYAIVALDVATGSLESILRAPSEHLMPFAVDGAVYASLLAGQGDVGLGVVDPRSKTVTSKAPLGPGTDSVTLASGDGRWLALQHTAPGGGRVLVGYARATGRVESLGLSVSDEMRALGFVEGAP